MLKGLFARIGIMLSLLNVALILIALLLGYTLPPSPVLMISPDDVVRVVTSLDSRTGANFQSVLTPFGRVGYLGCEALWQRSDGLIMRYNALTGQIEEYQYERQSVNTAQYDRLSPDWQWLYQAEGDGYSLTHLGNHRKIELPKEIQGEIRWSDNSRLILAGTWLYRLDDASLVRLPLPDDAQNIQWSEDAAALAFTWGSPQRYLGIIRLEDAQFQPYPSIEVLVGERTLRWSKDNQHLALVGREALADNAWSETRAFLVDTLTGQYRNLTSLDFGVTFGQFSPNGRYLPYIDTVAKHLSVLDTDLGTVWHSASSVTNSTEPIWSPDGRYLLARTGSGRLLLIDFENQQIHLTEQEFSGSAQWLDLDRFIFQAQRRMTYIARWQGDSPVILGQFNLNGAIYVCE